jgi:hypothetical protein
MRINVTRFKKVYDADDADGAREDLLTNGQ